jgi:hypothetical protein
MHKPRESRSRDVDRVGAAGLGTVLSLLTTLDHRLAGLEESVADVQRLLQHQAIQKEWYSTTELAAALHVTQHTVQERWCNGGRIEAEKDPDTGKWRIPGREFRRLVKGGTLKSKKQ